VSNRRRLGHVNVICVLVFTCVGGKGGKEGHWALGKGPKRRAVDSERGAGKGRSSQLHTYKELPLNVRVSSEH
jgi:hypothetical protein